MYFTDYIAGVYMCFATPSITGSYTREREEYIQLIVINDKQLLLEWEIEEMWGKFKDLLLALLCVCVCVCHHARVREK